MVSNAFLRSRLATYNYYGKIFNLNFSILSLWKSVFLGRGLHVRNCEYTAARGRFDTRESTASQWRWQVNISLLSRLKQKKKNNREKKVNNKMR